MKYYIVVSILLLAVTVNAQHLVLNSDLKAPYAQEVALPVANHAYVLVKDSRAYLYNANSTLPYKTKNIKDSYILNTVENKLYSINFVPLYIDQIDEDTEELTTLVTYIHTVNFCTIDRSKTDEWVKQYGYLIPQTAIPETFKFNKTLNIADTYNTSVYQDFRASRPTHHLRIDKENVLTVDASGNLNITEVKNHKVNRVKKWRHFNGSLNLLSSIKIGDVARIKFQRYHPENNIIEDFWSIINIKTQTFVSIDLNDFNANLKELQEQDIPLLNCIPFFYKAENESNIELFVLPDANFVWLDNESYYFGSSDLINYATMQEEDKSYNLGVYAYLFNHPSRILRAIAPQEKKKIRALEETYVQNKHKILSDRQGN